MALSANPAEEMRWCSLGCGLEMTADRAPEGKCPKCGKAVAPLGWRYRNSRGVMEYVSMYDSLPPEVRAVTAR